MPTDPSVVVRNGRVKPAKKAIKRSGPKVKMVGKRFGKLMVIKESDQRWASGLIVWECKCDCGRSCLRLGKTLRKGATTSCGCYAKPLLIRLNKERVKLPPGEAAFNMLILQYKRPRGVKRRKYVWELTKEQARNIFLKNCHYCDRPPSQIGKINLRPGSDQTDYGIFLYNGIDRVDNSVGYTIDNTVPCCKTCNKAKSTMTQDTFLSWVKSVYLHSLSRRTSNGH